MFSRFDPFIFSAKFFTAGNQLDSLGRKNVDGTSTSLLKDLVDLLPNISTFERQERTT